MHIDPRRLQHTFAKHSRDFGISGNYNAANAADLRTIYATLDPQLVIKPQKTEVTSLFAGAGILVLMIGGTLSLLWLGRLP